MFWVIPWLAVASVVFFAAYGSSFASDRPVRRPGRLGVFVGLAVASLVLLAVSLIGSKGLGDLAPTVMGLAFGLLGAAAVGAFDDALGDTQWLRPIGISIAVASLCWLRRENAVESARVLLGAGVGAASGSVWVLSKTRGASVASAAFALFMLFGASVSILGSLRLDGRATSTGAVIGMMAVACLAAAFFLHRLQTESIARAGSIIGAALFALALYGSSQQYFKVPPMGWLGVLGVASAAASAWLIPEGSPRGSNWRILASAILWLAVATIGFATLRGFGMAVCALSGLATLAILGAKAPLPAMSPLLALVLFRVFRELQPDAARALDIGQHYGLVGIFLGWLLVAASGEWVASRRAADGIASWVSDLALVAGLAGLVGMGSILLGAKGSVGMVVGLASAPLVAAVQGRLHSGWTIAGCAVSGALCAGYINLLPLTAMEKPEKIRLLAWIGLAVVAALALAAWLGRGTRTERELA